MSESQSSGRSAEALALQHLSDSGLRLLERNWSCRSGELDLVMLDGDTVVFVEVRYRRHTAWGGALESVFRCIRIQEWNAIYNERTAQNE